MSSTTLNKTLISPSLLSCDFLNIEQELRAFDGIDDIWFHLDIMDGHFVPNLTFGHPIIEKIVAKSTHKCDAHFMVNNPEFYAKTTKNYGIYNFTFHYEATQNPLALIKNLKDNFQSIGISIKPGTPTSALSDEILSAVNLVLIMSVEPGFGGQAFLNSAFDKIISLKARREQLNASFQIQVDGGVTHLNAHKLIDLGADNLVAGSYIFKSGQQYYKEKIDSLRSPIDGHKV